MTMKAMIAVAAVSAAFLACSKSPVEQTQAPQLEYTTDSLNVLAGGSLRLVALTSNTTASPQYVSRDSSIAVVSAEGLIFGLKMGTTHVIATLTGHPDVRDSVRVRVVFDSCSISRPDFGGPATEAERLQFAYNAAAPINLVKSSASVANGVEISQITYDSPAGGSVTGLMFVPVNRPGARPGIVLMHGGPGNAAQMGPQGVALAQHGAVVIAIDAPHARRTGDWVQFTDQDRAEQIQLIKDLQRAVDVLRSQFNVDSTRIAYIGISFGGAMGALFVGIEKRLKAAVLEVPDGGLVTHFTDHLSFNVESLACAQRLNWFRAMVPIEPIRFIKYASPTPLLLQNGRFDTAVAAADAEVLHAAAPEPKTLRWYDTGHAIGMPALIDRHTFLHEHIGLDLLGPQ